jgi:hypothetical protein
MGAAASSAQTQMQAEHGRVGCCLFEIQASFLDDLFLKF